MPHPAGYSSGSSGGGGKADNERKNHPNARPLIGHGPSIDNFQNDLLFCPYIWNDVSLGHYSDKTITFNELVGISYRLKFGDFPRSGDQFSQLSLGWGEYFGITVGRNYSVKNIHGKPGEYFYISVGLGAAIPIIPSAKAGVAK